MDAFPTTVRERFAAHGVADVDALLADRARAVEQAAPLRAFREAFSTLRDVEKAKIIASLRFQAGDMAVKLSEAKLEAQALADPRLAMLLDEAQLKLARLAMLEDQISALSERVRARDADVRFLSAEARLG